MCRAGRLLDLPFARLNDDPVEAIPVAASTALAPLLAGPARAVSVVAALPGAVYLSTGSAACPAVCLAVPSAVRVPCAAVVPAGVPLPALRVGTGGVAGGGRGLVVGPLSVRVSRWWAPPRPRLAGAAGSGDLAGLDVRALLGAGPGLTPYGDDVLAGALVTLAATGAPVPDFAARERVFERTTFVSAALLAHAARGECVPQLAAVLAAVATGAPLPIEALLAVGHTSGAGLFAGVRAILPALRSPAQAP